MTDETPAPGFDPDEFMARYRAYQARAAELHAGNKATVLAVLRDAGISKVTVTFNGYGDSGQIDSIAVKAGDTDAELPDSAVEIARASLDSEAPERLSEPLADAIETLCYALLEEKHDGWENNEGAYGEFVFDIAADRIVLDFNYRIETSENHTHEI
jgi:hypothetical protein